MNKYFNLLLSRVLGLTTVLLVFLYAATRSEAITFTFSDNDFLSGASWGEMTITAENSNRLRIIYNAASGSVIPNTAPDIAQVTGFGFAFNTTPPISPNPDPVSNPLNTVFSGDRDDLVWIRLNNLNAIPNPANGDEFTPNITKNEYSFGVTEGNSNNINPPGIKPDQFDIFYINFPGIGVNLTTISLMDFINYTGIRIQSLPDNINGGSLFLAGNIKNGSGDPIPEPTTMVLLGIGLVGLTGAAARRRFKKEKKQ